MQRSNRKIVFTAPQTVEVQQEEVSTDGLGRDELLIESLYSVVSAGTELACLAGREAWFSLPRVPGYATVGRVAALGGAVTGLCEGEVVLHYGGHQSFNRRKQGDFLLPVPEGIDGAVAAMTRLATVAFTSIRVSDIEAGDFVAVAGLGAVGNLAAQLAQIQGGRVIGVDVSAGRIALARKCGIEQTVNAAQEDAAARLEELTGGEGAAAVIDATGNPRAIAGEMEWVGKRGELILLGTPRGGAGRPHGVAAGRASLAAGLRYPQGSARVAVSRPARSQRQALPGAQLARGVVAAADRPAADARADHPRREPRRRPRGLRRPAHPQRRVRRRSLRLDVVNSRRPSIGVRSTRRPIAALSHLNGGISTGRPTLMK